MRMHVATVVLVMCMASLAISKSDDSPKNSESASSCFDRVDVAEAQSSYLETRLDLPPWSMSNFTSIDQVDVGVQLPLGVGHSGLLQLGRTGPDAATFTATMVQHTASLVRPSGMSVKGEIRVFFERVKRKHRMSEAATKYLKTATRAILVIPYIEVSVAQSGGRAVADFFKVVSDSVMSDSNISPSKQLDLTAALAESADVESSHGSVIFPSAGMSHDSCSETVYAVLSRPIRVPVGALSQKNIDRIPSHVVNSSFVQSAALSLIPFPTIGKFTKKELKSRQIFYMTGASIMTAVLISAGLFVAARKNGISFSSVRAYGQLDQDEDISKKLGVPSVLLPLTSSTKPVDLEQQGKISEKISEKTNEKTSDKKVEDFSNEDFSNVRTSLNEVRTWRMAFSVFLYILYVAICCYTAALGYATTTCYQGMPWEDHAPFFFLFLIVKSWEIYLFAYSPSTKGQVLSLAQFMIKFVSSMFGYLDGYTDAIALNIARACYSQLWPYMLVAFIIGVVIAQWIILAVLAILLDSSGKCFYKVLHMDVTANCIEFNQEDRYAKLVWQAINWSRFALEDLPQTVLQSLFVIYVRKNLIMILSITVSLGSSLFAAVSAATIVISYATGEVEKKKALSELKALADNNDELEKLREAAQRAKNLGVDDDNVFLKEVLEMVKTREAKDRSWRSAPTEDVDQAGAEPAPSKIAVTRAGNDVRDHKMINGIYVRGSSQTPPVYKRDGYDKFVYFHKKSGAWRIGDWTSGELQDQETCDVHSALMGDESLPTIPRHWFAEDGATAHPILLDVKAIG